MNPFTPQPAANPETPVFPPTPHTLRPIPEAATKKSRKRDNIFSKSRDMREDRGTRGVKNTHNSQSLPHGQ
jgi:hypothetical protein